MIRSTILITCRQCGAQVEKPRRAKNKPAPLYCSQACCGLAKRNGTKADRAARRVAYNRQWRHRNRDRVREQERKRQRLARAKRLPFELTPERVKRFWSYVDRRGPDECWPWTRWIDRNGYARFVGQGAHRVAVMASGREIPAGMVIDHICRRRHCMNPAHLRIVTPAENVLLNSEAPSAKNLTKTHCLNGHALSGDNLYVCAGGRRVCKQCRAARKRTYRARNYSDNPVHERKVADVDRSAGRASPYRLKAGGAATRSRRQSTGERV